MAMKHLVSYSGGLGSFMAAHRVIEMEGKGDVVLFFMDTRTEDEDLYRFLGETVAAFGVEFHQVRDGRNIWQVFNDVKFMGNNRVDPCSKHLKRDLAKKWIQQHYRPEECVMYVGIGWEEMHRLGRIRESWTPFTIKAPLTKPPYVERGDILAALSAMSIAPPRLYGMGFAHNNCGGFCIKSGQAQFKRLLENFPERYRWHEQEQEKLFAKIGKHGFIRMVRNGVQLYLSLREFREHLEKQESIDEEDVGGCGCFV